MTKIRIVFEPADDETDIPLKYLGIQAEDGHMMTRVEEDHIGVWSADGEFEAFDLEVVPFAVPIEEKPQRYTARQDQRFDRVLSTHFVYDERMQIEVFHWTGTNGREKCEAVANALNALGHEID